MRVFKNDSIIDVKYSLLGKTHLNDTMYNSTALFNVFISLYNQFKRDVH